MRRACITVFVFLLALLLYCNAGHAAEIQLYMKTPTAGVSPPVQLGKFEPPFGALLGATIDRDSKLCGDITRAKDVYGRPYSAMLVYVDWGQPAPVEFMQQAGESNAAVQLAWNPSLGLEVVVDDEYVREFARALADYGKPVFLRFGGEMNGDWTPWGGRKRAELYKEKFRLIANIMHSTAPNVAMVWSPNSAPDDGIEDYYPGDAYVDWVGINGYADYYFKGDPQYDNKQWAWTKFYEGHQANPLARYRKIYNMFADRKPIMISEVGVAWFNKLNNQLVDDWGAYTLKRLYCYLPLVYPRIKAIYYFNSGIVEDFSRYSVCDNETMLQAYIEAIKTPYYLADCYAESPFYYDLLGNAAPAELCDIAAYVDTGETKVGSVEYYLDGKFIGRSYDAPWEITCHFPAKGGTVTLDVRAIGPGGNLIYKKSFRIFVPAWQPIRIEVNGNPLNLDVPPVIYNNRTMAPLRAIAESFGLDVKGNAAERSVELNGRGKEIVLTIDNQTALNNGEEVNLDLPPRVAEGRVLVPLRWIAETLNLKVNWDGRQRVIRISK